MLALLCTPDSATLALACQALRAMCVSAESANLLVRLKLAPAASEQLQLLLEQHGWKRAAVMLGLLANVVAHKAAAATLAKAPGAAVTQIW